MHYLSACLIVVDENEYLAEWIEFHRLVGVEHFYIYDNESKVPVSETLKRDIEKGHVTVFPCPGVRMQVPTYSRCANDHRKESVWLAVIDVDEFLFPTKQDDLRIFLREYERYGGLVVSSLFFGSSGHKIRPEGLQIDNFIMRMKDESYENTFIKSIVQLSKLREVTDPHIIRTISGWPMVNENGEAVTSWRSTSTVRRIRLNHYFLRSEQEFKEKRERHIKNKKRTLEKVFESIDPQCIIEDRTITRYSERLKTAMRRRNT